MHGGEKAPLRFAAVLFGVEKEGSSAVIPGAAGEQRQNGEDLQTACQHIKGQHQLGKGGESTVIAGRSYSFKAGADVIEAGDDGREVGHGGEIVQGDDQEACNNNDNVSCQIGIGVIQDRLIYHLAVAADHLDLPGTDDLADVASQALDQQQNPDALDAAAGRAGAGTHHHEHQQNGFGKAGP